MLGLHRAREAVLHPGDLSEFATLDVDTLEDDDQEIRSVVPDVYATVLAHPDPDMVGAHACLKGLAGGTPVALSRATPRFQRTSGEAVALGHARLSRQPVWFELSEGVLTITAPARVKASVEGQPVAGELGIPTSRLDAGFYLSLRGCVAVFLRRAEEPPGPIDAAGMIGTTPVMEALRARIARLAPARGPVLIRGESGCGKELVARALHTASPRAEGPLRAVNVSAVPPQMAAALLFGHARGAFTGAEEAQDGWFIEADGGTLFLDEVGEMPAELQPQLLRALDSGEIQPLGRPVSHVDVRVVAATDADLENLVATGRMRNALFHRLRGSEIVVPPLRARRADVPLLFLAFTRDYLEDLGATDRLLAGAATGRPWLTLELIEQLMAYDFPGNVRELQHVAFDIVVHSRDAKVATLPVDFDQRQVSHPEPANPGQATLELTEWVVRRAMKKTGFNVTAAARSLDVAKNTLIAAIDASPGLRLARDLEADQILGTLASCDGKEAEAAVALEVSLHGLRLRMSALGLR